MNINLKYFVLLIFITGFSFLGILNTKENINFNLFKIQDQIASEQTKSTHLNDYLLKEFFLKENPYCEYSKQPTKSLMVDIKTQRIYVYKTTVQNGELTCDVINVYNTTSGTKENPTPLGVYALGGEYDVKIYDQPVNFIPFKYELIRGIPNFWGLHQAPWQDQSKIGEPGYQYLHGSKGCLNIKNEDWESLKSHIHFAMKITLK